MRLTPETLALALAALAAVAVAVAVAPLTRDDGALKREAGLLTLPGRRLAVTASVHATQPSKSSWKKRLISGKKLIRTSTMIPSSVK